MIEQGRIVPEYLIPYELKAVIFDKDGVLMDTEPLYYEATVKMLGELGVLSARERYSMGTHEGLTGIGSGSFMKFLKDEFSLTGDEEDLKNLFRRNLKNLFRGNYWTLMKDQLRPMDGVEILLKELGVYGIKTAVATGASRRNADYTLGIVGLNSFERVITNDDVVKGKPHPGIFLEAARGLSVMPEHCLVIGDSWNDILGAKRAGMKVVLLSKKWVEPKAGVYPDLVIDSMNKLNVDLMKGLWRV